jgi:hypothetical protein
MAAGLICWWALVGRLAWSGQEGQPREEQGAEIIRDRAADKVMGQNSYAGLAELITMIGNDAASHFQYFYGETLVEVKPFTMMSESKNQKISLLGAALTDQMAAEINNLEFHLGFFCGRTPQRLTGVLAEINGYLRVHISGVNRWGELRSYVVLVEMSEPIYRGLHTFL